MGSPKNSLPKSPDSWVLFLVPGPGECHPEAAGTHRPDESRLGGTPRTGDSAHQRAGAEQGARAGSIGIAQGVRIKNPVVQVSF